MELKMRVARMFCLLLLTLLLSSVFTEGGRRDELCKAPSRRYTGFCNVIRCVNTCKGEGYTSGMCASPTASCYCSKLCAGDQADAGSAATSRP
ncbi:unnamed protein product [Spirodela intermedia]|uniref:Knottins-like domain-containing protein n=2 Tax=Spirodela intermedia TaxID=51605 RepID=A0A7I8IJ76_SPIIN|nr:unnamed protein product [Spirodela intermedia]CAA6657926.1 unnamed protein product [Spirodela intermedia]CAA7394056.1 unnamed protein product [Spirodela intermedia]